MNLFQEGVETWSNGERSSVILRCMLIVLLHHTSPHLSPLDVFYSFLSLCCTTFLWKFLAKCEKDRRVRSITFVSYKPSLNHMDATT